MMQSSPPQRATDRAPSPTTSQYSIDLAALELDSRSGASTPLPAPHVDQILSEDIDGPSDFTQNMEAWMRGGSVRKSGLQSLKEKPEEDGELPNAGEKKDMGLQQEDDRTASNHTPSNSPPRSAGSTKRRAVEKDIESESVAEWEPYAASQIPQPPQAVAPKTLLQPTVEEYYSELTPAPKSIMNHDNVFEPISPTNSESFQSEGRASSPTISPVRSPILQHSTPRFSSSRRLALEEQLEQFRTECQRLEALNTTINYALEEERRGRREENDAHERKLSDAARRERDLTEMKDQSQQHKEDFRRDFSNLKERLQLFERQQVSHREEMERLKREHASTIQNLKEQFERERREHSQEIRAAEQDVELARRSRDDAEETARGYRDELDEQTAELDKMKMEIQQGEELREGIKEQLRSARMENERLSDPSNADEEAQEEIESLRTELNDVQQQLKEAQEAAAAAASTPPPLKYDKMEKEILDLRSKYNYAIVERHEAQDALSKAKHQFARDRATMLAERQAEEKAYEDRVKDAEAVNAAQAARIAAGIRKREEYWRTRLSGVEEERRVMAKALLRSWGREEVGEGFDAIAGGVERDGESGWQWYEYLFKLANGNGNGVDEGKCVRWF